MVSLHPEVVDLCANLPWQMRMVANSSQYTFLNALSDFSGLGTIYQLGSDWAVSNRNGRSIAWIQGIQPVCDRSNDSVANKAKRLCEKSRVLFEDEKSALSRSVLSKIAYLGMLGMIFAGAAVASNFILTIGALGTVGCGSFFMAKAGLGSVDHTMDDRIQNLEKIRNELAASMRSI